MKKQIKGKTKQEKMTEKEELDFIFKMGALTLGTVAAMNVIGGSK